ncbi:MAG: beta-lactamase family protein [Alistipes sp.]|nr:beta-lactamase family protein [Alistipes sp.]
MSQLTFHYKKPEETGIDPSWIINFLNRLENCHLPMHGFILMKDDNIVAETYYAPYTQDTPHRMFSVTKSFVSVAIGLLADEGKLSLDDPIVSHFPEKLDQKEASPYLTKMTIRDMLTMTSCHSKTTYKAPGCTDWVGSFFTTTPSHAPGTTFSYDTSATHTLCALVEKLTGMKMLDYLRAKFLDDVGFSKDAYVLEAPGTESLGGSGLVCTPMDLLRFIYVISKNGSLDGRQLLPAGYLKAATEKQVDTYGKSATWEEMQGYGYQFWITTHNGYACYGMGGQYALVYPEKNIIVVTTADTQGRQGGTQLIYDAFYQEIYDKIGTENLSSSQSCGLDKYLKNRSLFYVEGDNTSPVADRINGVRYEMDANPMGFVWVSLSFKKYDGTFDYETDKGVFSLPFSIQSNQVVQFPYYHYKACVSGAFRDSNTFLIKAHIVDECVGNLFIQLVFKGNDVTVMMRKFEETMFNEFDGFMCGHRS